MLYTKMGILEMLHKQECLVTVCGKRNECGKSKIVQHMIVKGIHQWWDSSKLMCHEQQLRKNGLELQIGAV